MNKVLLSRLSKGRGSAVRLLTAGLLASTAFWASADRASAESLLMLAEDVPSGLDVDGPSVAIPTTQLGMVQLIEPLIAYELLPEPNADGVRMPDFTKPEGRLMESWSFDPDRLTWTLNLRRGVKSCAGNEFTADDVIWTWERGLNAGSAVPNSWFLMNMANVKGFTTDVFSSDPDVAAKARQGLSEGVRKIDDYTVEVEQTQANPLFLINMAVTIAEGMFDATEMKKHLTDADPWGYDYANNVNFPSFGPYCLESWVKNDEIRFRANPDYYRGEAAIKNVVIKKVPQAGNRIGILRGGQAQLIQGLTPNQYDSIRSMPGFKVSSVQGNEGLFLVLNFQSPPFDNVKLRQALAYAIPYERVIQVGYGGQANKWEGVIPSSYPSFIPADPAYEYNIEKAKELLAEAGYPDGNGLEQFAENFKLTYVAEKETTLGPIVNQIRTALTEIGVPVTLDPIPQAQYGDRQIVKRDLAFAVNDQEKPIGVDTGYAMQLFFVSKKAGGNNNMMNYENDELDALWAKAQVEMDTAKRDEMLAEMQRQAMRDVAWLPVVEFKTQWAHTDRLKGISWDPGNSILFYDLHY